MLIVDVDCWLLIVDWSEAAAASRLEFVLPLSALCREKERWKQITSRHYVT